MRATRTAHLIRLDLAYKETQSEYAYCLRRQSNESLWELLKRP
jgi:hypothetical protein